MDTLSVDGARPAVERVAALPRSWTTPAERLVLMVLACDSFDGETCAPSYDRIADWTGMHRSSVGELLTALTKPNSRRPSLLTREETTRGGRRTVWRLLLPEPSGATGRSDEVEAYPQPSGAAGLSNRPAEVDGKGMQTVAEPSPNRPARPDGNRPAPQDAPSSTRDPLWLTSPPTEGTRARVRAYVRACELPGQLTVHEVIDEIRIADPPDPPDVLADFLAGEAGPCAKCRRTTRRYGPRSTGPLCVECGKARSA